MKAPENRPNHCPANSSDFVPVAVCFLDPTINLLFAEILRARGVQVDLLNSISDLKPETKIITESVYFPIIADSHRDKCLIVLNGDGGGGIDALSLARPLTEEKVEAALAQLLKP